MRKVKGIRLAILAAGVLYIGSVQCNVLNAYNNYLEAETISRNTENPPELRAVAKKFADTELARSNSSKMLNPFCPIEQKPYERVYRLKERE